MRLKQTMKQKGMSLLEISIELMNHVEAKGEIKCVLKAATLVNGLWVFIHFTFQNAEIKYVS